ncbi:hypothetical protein D3C73_1555210 [compost metagenome]
MGQRRFELFQHVAIDLGLLTLNLQAHLLAEAAAEIANHAHLSGQDIGERPHAASQRGVVQHLCALTGLPGELIQFGVFFHQQLLGFRQQTARIF